VTRPPVLPRPAGAWLAGTLVERNALSFRRQWVAFATGFAEPVFYLLSLGVGLGALVGAVTSQSGRAVPYAVFIAPAMLATSAMNAGVMDSTFNVFFKLNYAKLYDSILATRMGPRDIAIGEVTWSLLRGGAYAAAFLAVAALAGLVPSWWGVLALPAAVFVAFAFSAVGMFATTFMRSWVDFDYVNLVVQPLFLLSATFFPLTAYPPWAQWLVQATPLYHGVELCRSLCLGEVGAGLLWHVGYLAVMGGLGVVGAARRVDQLLLR